MSRIAWVPDFGTGRGGRDGAGCRRAGGGAVIVVLRIIAIALAVGTVAVTTAGLLRGRRTSRGEL